MPAESFLPLDLELTEDVVFSQHGLRLDILRPAERSPQPTPAILHIHGGAWMMYGKWPVANVFLARAGFVTLSVDYRLAPGARFPAPIHDVKTAVRWLRAHADELGVDPQRVGVWGVSAGAHLAAMLGTSAGHPGLEGAEGGWAGRSSTVQAVGNVCGVTDFLDPALPLGAEPWPIFGAFPDQVPGLATLTSPVAHASSTSAPFLHLHGRQDIEVPVSQARRLHAALRAAGARSELVELDGGHLIHESHQAEIEGRLLAFFRRELVVQPSHGVRAP